MPKKSRAWYSVGLVTTVSFGILLMMQGCGWTNSMIFHPPRSSYNTRDVEIIRRKNGQVAVKCLENSSAKYTILYSHGNAEDLGHTLELMRAFRDRGFSVITYDYPGYGLSVDYGRGPTEKGAYWANIV